MQLSDREKRLALAIKALLIYVNHLEGVAFLVAEDAMHPSVRTACDLLLELLSQ